jgi:polyferredoxin
MKKPWAPSLLFGALVFVPVYLFSRPLIPAEGGLLPGLLWAAFTAGTGVMILRTGKVSRWRALFFFVLAAGFILSFKAELIGLGRFFTSESPQEVPYCHIALASTALGHLYQQYLAFMSGSWKSWGPLSLGVLWLVVTLALGQGWCSWACFYGGIDDGISRILPKPLLRWESVPGRLRDFPAALLVFLLLVSLSTLLPIFCLWLCPLKLTTSFLDPVDSTRKVQFALMLVAGAVFLVGLPLLTGKRAFCGLLCPFGAWQAAFGRINPFRVTLDPAACTSCGLCTRACPTFCLPVSPEGKPEVLSYCNRCGQCMDACPSSCIRYTVLGRDLPGKHPLWDARVLFVYCALVVSGTLGMLFVPKAVLRLIELI